LLLGFIGEYPLFQLGPHIFRMNMPASAIEMTGTTSQLEWAEQIRLGVAAEFDRVEAAFRATAEYQPEPDRTDTVAVISILNEKRAEILARTSAGYFIRDWQELDGRVRQVIADDPRYQAIKTAREARRHVLPLKEKTRS
jgi:hypothetical protein